MFSSRVLRRRWVLAVIFGCSFIYFITSTFKQSQTISVEEHTPRLKVPAESFKWQPRIEQINATKIKTCRNSVQGKTLIADERGYVCERKDVTVGGCCDNQSKTTKQFVCDTCLSSGCCSIYEHCVSCCLQPEKQPLLRKILSKAADTFQNLFASVTDHFELCLAKCRTSSQSVQHENSYRDPVAKYCYGESPPDLQPIAL